MKRMLILAISIPLALMAANYPQAPSSDAYIVDQADIISPAYEQEIASICSDVEHSKGFKMQVLTVETTGEADIDDYAEQVRQSWAEDSSNSRSLLLVVAKQDHKVATASGGEVKNLLARSTVDRVRSDILLPNFKEEKYGRGILWALRIYAQDIEGESGKDLDFEDANKNVEGKEINRYDDDAAFAGCMQAACLISWFMWWNDLWDHNHHNHHHRHNHWND